MGVYKKLDQAERELARVKLDLSLSKDQIEDMRKSAQKVEKENNDSRNKIRNLEIELKAADNACNKLRTEKDDLAAKLNTKQKEAASLRDQLNTTSKELAQKASNRVAVKDALKHAPFFVRWWTDKYIAEYLK